MKNKVKIKFDFGFKQHTAIKYYQACAKRYNRRLRNYNTYGHFDFMSFFTYERRLEHNQYRLFSYTLSTV